MNNTQNHTFNQNINSIFQVAVAIAALCFTGLISGSSFPQIVRIGIGIAGIAALVMYASSLRHYQECSALSKEIYWELNVILIALASGIFFSLSPVLNQIVIKMISP
jgi:hypothetical protein